MEIYLHIGYHKTGSSFLQMMFSSNRSLLEASGIYYPSEKGDLDAKQGRISPGNGLRLSQAIAAQNKNDFTDIMLSWIKDARSHNCRALLISSEGLFHSMSNNDFEILFQELGLKTQISQIHALLFLRDPQDHIFSLYKHRGKRGTIPDFMTWVERNYETLELTEQFLDKMDANTQIHLTFRKYKNDSQFLANAVFRDWLNISVPPIPEGDRVNASLSLSEIMVLQIIYGLLGQEKAVRVQQKLLKNNFPKPKEEFLKMHYAYQIGSFIEKHVPLIQRINKKMPEGEHLDVEIQSQPQNNLEFVVLTNEQLKIIIEESNTNVGLKYKVLEKVKRLYRAIC